MGSDPAGGASRPPSRKERSDCREVVGRPGLEPGSNGLRVRHVANYHQRPISGAPGGIRTHRFPVESRVAWPLADRSPVLVDAGGRVELPSPGS